METFHRILAIPVLALFGISCGGDEAADGPPSPTTPCASTMVSYGGRLYHTVQIGSQCWMKENLDVGTMIDSSRSAVDNGIIEKYCYRNDPLHCNTYGGLYQWKEAMQYSTTPGTQGICPTGWHIPIDTELYALSSTVSGNGNALKAVGQGTGDGAGTNTSGFSALLGGFRLDYDSSFYYLGVTTHIWGSVELDTAYASLLMLDHNERGIFFSDYNSKYNGHYVRCLQD